MSEEQAPPPPDYHDSEESASARVAARLAAEARMADRPANRTAADAHQDRAPDSFSAADKLPFYRIINSEVSLRSYVLRELADARRPARSKSLQGPGRQDARRSPDARLKHSRSPRRSQISHVSSASAHELANRPERRRRTRRARRPLRSQIQEGDGRIRALLDLCAVSVASSFAPTQGSKVRLEGRLGSSESRRRTRTALQAIRTRRRIRQEPESALAVRRRQEAQTRT